MRASRKIAWYGAGIFAAGLLAGFSVAQILSQDSSQNTGHSLRITVPSRPLIKPLLACNIDSATPSTEFDGLKNNLDDAINRAKASGDISRASIYVRSLANGSWTAVNGDDQFRPASLMKIVTLMVYMEGADSDPGVLSQTLAVQEYASDNEQNILPEQTAIAGKTYTVEELLRLMIVYSDNNASRTLIANINPGVLNKTLQDLEIPQYADNANYTISPRLYSRFLRILYNSTLISEQNSERSLEWLSQSAYKDALVAGVDPSDIVAHKFGESSATNTDGSTTYQHHDCGIVYDTSPYVICVMTEGKDLSTLAKTIASLTTTVDTFIMGQYGK